MASCDKCGGEFEELVDQPNGTKFCVQCHRGLSSEMTDEEYNRLRIAYDKDVDFKRLRHRFWSLGLARRYKVLLDAGFLKPGESMMEKTERFHLYKIKEAGLEADLEKLIEVQEAEILAENEKSEYIEPKDIPMGETSGRAHAGRAELKREG